MSNNKTHPKVVNAAEKTEAGFTLVEAVCAIFVVTIGLIGTAAAITYALEFGAISRNVTSAKSVIVSTVEEVETLRNARRLEFGQIANAGDISTGIAWKTPFSGFTKDFQPVSLNPGADGVNGTADDLIDAGADGKFGTQDDFENEAFNRLGYERKIEITNLSPTIKEITVTVRYTGRAGKRGEISGVCYLNDESRVTH